MTYKTKVADLLGTSIEQLREADSVSGVQRVVRTSARRLVHADGATIVLREGNLCFYADEDAIGPLWKGQRFDIDTCISGWAMRNTQIALVPDITTDSRIPLKAYRPTFVRSLAIVPVGLPEPFAAIGVYWAHTRHVTTREVARLSTLADATAQALWRLLPGAHERAASPSVNEPKP